MGIQDRDYWNDWQREKQGIKGYSARPFSPQKKPARRFRVIDKVRVMPGQNEPQPVRVHRHADFSVAKLLLLFFLVALCFVGYVLYRIFIL